MKYARIIDILTPITERSLFLLGARQTGKTTLLENLFPTAKIYNLLDAKLFQELTSNPSFIREQLTDRDRLIVIDEIQKLPSLLDEVHFMIERNKQLRFVLTGSSARKLRRGGANLLAGRARIRYLHPLVSAELGYTRIMDQLTKGGLPFILDSTTPKEDLKTYCGTYLQQEIKAESIVRSIENFSRFLLVAGLTNGTQLNFENVGRDVGFSPRTVREYYYIIQDTLLGYLIEPFQGSRKRKSVGIPKFYFFDVGVANYLAKRSDIERGSKDYGDTLEHFIFTELIAYIDYNALDLPLTYWRTTTKFEVDFIIGDKIAIEVKGKSRVPEHDLKGMRALKEEGICKRYIVVTDEIAKRVTEDGIELWPIEFFLRALWRGEIVSGK